MRSRCASFTSVWAAHAIALCSTPYASDSSATGRAPARCRSRASVPRSGERLQISTAGRSSRKVPFASIWRALTLPSVKQRLDWASSMSSRHWAGHCETYGRRRRPLEKTGGIDGSKLPTTQRSQSARSSPAGSRIFADSASLRAQPKCSNSTRRPSCPFASASSRGCPPIASRSRFWRPRSPGTRIRLTQGARSEPSCSGPPRGSRSGQTSRPTWPVVGGFGPRSVCCAIRCPPMS